MLWGFGITLLILSFSWGRMEKGIRLLKQGYHNPEIGRDKQYAVLTALQGTVTLILFALMGIGFFAFGWKIGLIAVFASFASQNHCQIDRLHFYLIYHNPRILTIADMQASRPRDSGKIIEHYYRLYGAIR